MGREKKTKKPPGIYIVSSWKQNLQASFQVLCTSALQLSFHSIPEISKSPFAKVLLYQTHSQKFPTDRSLKEKKFYQIINFRKFLIIVET